MSFIVGSIIIGSSVMAGSSLAGGLIGRGKKKRAITSAEAEHSKRMNQYDNLDTSNIYAGFQNTMEDLTVNQQQAQFQQQQQRQSQANILSSLRGSAGSSGIAGLAQALSGQANLAAQQSSASIGMQERQNQMASAQGAMQAQQMRLGGADQARNLEMSKTSTLLGMSQQRLGAAKEALAQNDAAMYQGIGAAGGMFAGAMAGGLSNPPLPPESGGESVPFDGNFSSDRPYGGDLPDFGGGRSSVNGKTNVDDSMFKTDR